MLNGWRRWHGTRCCKWEQSCGTRHHLVGAGCSLICSIAWIHICVRLPLYRCFFLHSFNKRNECTWCQEVKWFRMARRSRLTHSIIPTSERSTYSVFDMRLLQLIEREKKIVDAYFFSAFFSFSSRSRSQSMFRKFNWKDTRPQVAEKKV